MSCTKRDDGRLGAGTQACGDQCRRFMKLQKAKPKNSDDIKIQSKATRSNAMVTSQCF
jgi:hypothetical protein